MQTQTRSRAQMSEYGFMQITVKGPTGGSVSASYYGGESDTVSVTSDNGVGLGGGRYLQGPEGIKGYAMDVGRAVYLSNENVADLRDFLAECEERACIEKKFIQLRRSHTPWDRSDLGRNYVLALKEKLSPESMGGVLADQLGFDGERGTLELPGLTNIEVFRPAGQNGFVLIGELADEVDSKIGAFEYEFDGVTKPMHVKQIALLCADSMNYTCNSFFIYDEVSALRVMQFAHAHCYDSQRIHREEVPGVKNKAIAAAVYERASRDL